MSARTLTPPRRARVADGLAPEVGARLRVLHAAGQVVHASRGLELHVSRDGGASFHLVADAARNVAQRALAVAPLASRLLRAGIHRVLPLSDGGHVAIVRGAILRREPGRSEFDLAHRVARGTRPLNLCRAGDGTLYFGEYFENPARLPVHVYASTDGRDWHVAYTFPAGTIRHVHAVLDDPFRAGVWVLTGDDGDEAGIWWTEDGFRTLTPVVRGFQGARAVSALPTQTGLIVPSDAPEEQNHVQRLDPASGRMERLAPVPGSVLSVGRTRGLALLSTALEPSSVNLDPRVALYASADGEDWRPVARFERDLALLRDIKGYLQYPMVLLPDGELDTGEVLATGQALRGLHGRLLRWDEAALLAQLGSPARR